MSSRLTRLKNALDSVDRAKRRPRNLRKDRILQDLIAQLVAARERAGMTQTEVAELMWTTKSVVSRLETGRFTRPTLSTIERYALAVGRRVEVKLR